MRASLEAMQRHSETNNVQRINLPQIWCGLDKLDRQKVRKLIHEVCQPTSIDLTVFLEPQSGTLNSSQTPMDSSIDTDTAKAHDDSDNIPSFASAQRNDPSLKHLLHWITRGTASSSQELQGLTRTTWKLAQEFRTLEVVNDILCREFIHKGGSSHYQLLIPASLVPQILKSIHSSPTGGHLGVFKTVKKVRERFYWPGFQELFINRCEQCQKGANPPTTYRHSLVQWTPSYHFHHIGIDFMGPLPSSNGNQHILLIGDHFSKWYEAIPFPDQTAPTTATALLENWICRSGCPHSIHSDQGRNFESKLFKALNQAL